jgi:ferredoxin
MNNEKEKLYEVNFKINIPEGDELNAIRVISSASLYDIIKTKIDIHTQCKQGACGVCRCPKPETGKIKYSDLDDPVGYVDRDENGEPSEILSCIGRVDVEGMLKEKGISNGILELKFLVPEGLLKQKPQSPEIKTQDTNKGLRRPKP